MQSEDRFLLAAAVFVVLTGSIVFGMNRSASASRASSSSGAPSAETAPVVASRAEAIGRNRAHDAAAKCAYVVVEFGDYQCPPCRALHPKLRQWVEEQGGKVGLIFRHNPLMEIHEMAFPAAIRAEAAREQGQFEAMHERLYTAQPLNPDAMNTLARSLALDPVKLKKAEGTSAKARVRDDISDALKMKIEATPTLLLCTPDGKAKPVSFDALKNEMPQD